MRYADRGLRNIDAEVKHPMKLTQKHLDALLLL
jgi:hypothetical protein